MIENETTADGWGSKFLAPIQNKDQEWGGCFLKAYLSVGNGGSLIIIGKRGCGKTRMAAEISRAGKFPNDIGGGAKTSVYRRISEILIELKDSFRSKNGEGEGRVIKYLSSAGLLVIDEFQERGETDWENRMITTIIDRRYADSLPTILIANLEVEEIEQKISDSVISRINESGGVIVCRCESFRRGAK